MAAHRAPDEEPGHAHDPVQMLAPRGAIPADPAVALGQVQRRSSEAQAAEPAVLGGNEIAHLRAHQRTRPLRVLAGHQLVPQPQLIERVDLDQRQALHVAGRRGYLVWFGHRLAQAPRAANLAQPTAARAARRQREVARVFKLAQRLHAAGRLRAATGINEAELAAGGLYQSSTIAMCVLGQKPADHLDRFRS